METFTNTLVDAGVQCWGCPTFDRMFQIISGASAAVYKQMVMFCILLFVVFLAFYILWSVWDNIRGGVKEPMYVKYFKPVVINGLVVMSLFGLGVWFPRFMTTITIEPITDITILYTQAAIGQTPESVEQKVTYQPAPMPDDGFYRPELRDKIILLLKTSTTQFQAMIKLGFAIMDKAFSWSALLGIGALIKHIIIFFMGMYMVWGFFKLFLRFCFYFIDTIVALTFYAFFFPISLIGFIFKNSSAAGWVQKLGENTGPKMLEKVIKSIITLAVAIITYIIVIVIISKFFAASGTSGADLAARIMDGTIYSGNLSDDNIATLTFSGCIVLVYLVTYLTGLVPEIVNTITETFDIKGTGKAELGEAVASDAEKVVKNVADAGKAVGQKIVEVVTK